MIHFAEFWHPTKTDDVDQNNNSEDENCEENECEVVELPCFEDTSTQPVFDDFGYDSDSEDGEAVNSNTGETRDERFSSGSWGSQ